MQQQLLHTRVHSAKHRGKEGAVRSVRCLQAVAITQIGGAAQQVCEAQINSMLEYFWCEAT